MSYHVLRLLLQCQERQTSRLQTSISATPCQIDSQLSPLIAHRSCKHSTIKKSTITYKLRQSTQLMRLSVLSKKQLTIHQNQVSFKSSPSRSKQLRMTIELPIRLLTVTCSSWTKTCRCMRLIRSRHTYHRHLNQLCWKRRLFQTHRSLESGTLRQQQAATNLGKCSQTCHHERPQRRS